MLPNELQEQGTHLQALCCLRGVIAVLLYPQAGSGAEAGAWLLNGRRTAHSGKSRVLLQGRDGHHQLPWTLSPSRTAALLRRRTSLQCKINAECHAGGGFPPLIQDRPTASAMGCSQALATAGLKSKGGLLRMEPRTSAVDGARGCNDSPRSLARAVGPPCVGMKPSCAAGAWRPAQRQLWMLLQRVFKEAVTRFPGPLCM